MFFVPQSNKYWGSLKNQYTMRDSMLRRTFYLKDTRKTILMYFLFSEYLQSDPEDLSFLENYDSTVSQGYYPHPDSFDQSTKEYINTFVQTLNSMEWMTLRNHPFYPVPLAGRCSEWSTT